VVVRKRHISSGPSTSVLEPRPNRVLRGIAWHAAWRGVRRVALLHQVWHLKTKAKRSNFQSKGWSVGLPVLSCLKELCARARFGRPGSESRVLFGIVVLFPLSPLRGHRRHQEGIRQASELNVTDYRCPRRWRTTRATLGRAADASAPGRRPRGDQRRVAAPPRR
jgi:hypothetical protein